MEYEAAGGRHRESGGEEEEEEERRGGGKAKFLLSLFSRDVLVNDARWHRVAPRVVAMYIGIINNFLKKGTPSKTTKRGI